MLFARLFVPLPKETSCMGILNKFLDWYFTKNALPYWCILIADLLVCYFSGIFVFWLYYHGAVTLANLPLLTKTISLYLLFNLIGFRIFKTYSGILRYSSFVDLQKVGYAMAFSCFFALVAHYFVNPEYQRLHFVPLQGRQIIAMYIVATVLMWAMRVMVKVLYEISFQSDTGVKTLIYGVKDGGIGLAKNLRNQKPSRFLLKGFISHEPASYEGRSLLGLMVYEVNDKLEGKLKELDIKAVMVSPLQNDRFRQEKELQDLLISLGIKIYMMSPKVWEDRTSSEADGSVDDIVSSLKEVSVEDLLPRDQIEVDMNAIGSLLRGKKILITGSAGSIGSEMVRQIAVYEPSDLILIDQAETPQHDIRLMMNKQWKNIKCETIVASITNKHKMEKIFQTTKPDYVFHAAAYKHVPMMENNPSESIHNNVYGTKVIADLSAKYGVKKFVMISTDKAVNPTNVMGCSKRICEIYVQSLNKNVDTQFVTTRFGNVLGSNGSVIPLFEKQIKAGGPVTVTDPNIIRFFMLIPEACKLVLEAGTHGRGGEIFVFDMGKPVKIADLAKRMILLSGAKNVKIEYTGLRAGEKLYEEVLSNTENTMPSFHEKIRIAKVREYDFDTISREVEELFDIAENFDDMATVKKMKEIVPEFISNNSKYSLLDKKSN